MVHYDQPPTKPQKSRGTLVYSKSTTQFPNSKTELRPRRPILNFRSSKTRPNNLPYADTTSTSLPASHAVKSWRNGSERSHAQATWLVTQTQNCMRSGMDFASSARGKMLWSGRARTRAVIWLLARFTGIHFARLAVSILGEIDEYLQGSL